MKLLTEVEVSNAGFSIDAGDGIVLLGSCFSDNIGERLAKLRFHCMPNPFGVLYNPLSISQAINIMIDNGLSGCTQGRRMLDDFMFESGDVWSNWMFSSNFSDTSREGCMDKAAESIDKASRLLASAKALIVTFGTVRAYMREICGKLFAVANCHKRPAKEFSVKDLSVSDIVQVFSKDLGRLFNYNKDIHVVFTVSPYRYFSYGAHNSALGKAALLLSQQQLIDAFPKHCHYFPAFEIMNDELRDYRFYSDDMLHPSAKAADYIFSKFIDFAFSDSAKTFAKEWTEVLKAEAHRPMFPESKAYKDFALGVSKKAADIERRYPGIADTIDFPNKP